MAELTQEELNERVAILRRFRSLLEQQKAKFQEYLKILEKQENSIEEEDTEALVNHAELEQQVAKGIQNLQKVIVPMSELYKNSRSSFGTKDSASVEEIQKDLSRLQTRVLAQNQKNRELLRVHLIEIRKQIESFKNPYRNTRSVYANKVAQGSLVAVEV